MTIKLEIAEWLERAKKQGATHVIVACDTFDWEDYPIFVMPGEVIADAVRMAQTAPMQKVMEVYDLSLPLEDQLNERRAYHI